MKKYCQGCGVKIQTSDPKKRGFIRSEVYDKDPNDFYCERCFKLIHYNKREDIPFNEDEFKNIIKRIATSKSLVVNVLDIFDLAGTFQENIRSYFPDNPLIVIGNKFDLFLNSVKVGKIENYLANFLEEKNISADGIMVLSSKKAIDLNRLYQLITKYQIGSKVYLFGTTNVGKSSIINGFMEIFQLPNKKLTTSTTIGTTLDFVEVSLPNGTTLFDTPVIPNINQATYYLNHKNAHALIPQKYIKPKVYQLHPGQTLFIGGFGYLQFVEGEKSSFVLNFPPALIIHRTKNENADSFFKTHQDDILKIPNSIERKRLGKMKKYDFLFDESKKDLCLSGLGFITLIGKGKVHYYGYDKIKVSYREAII